MEASEIELRRGVVNEGVPCISVTFDARFPSLKKELAIVGDGDLQFVDEFINATLALARAFPNAITGKLDLFKEIERRALADIYLVVIKGASDEI